MSSSSSSSLPVLQYAITVDLLAATILCLTAAICFVLLYNILSSLSHWLEPIRSRHASQSHHGHVFHRFVVRYDSRQSYLADAFERFVLDIDDRRAQRLRDSNKLPPLISYGINGEDRSATARLCVGDECVICLEDFEVGESCQVFPVCNHIFHTDCIDHWLKNRPTCPVCRHCILEL